MQIPLEILNILEKFSQANFEAYIVGGCVRDMLLNNSSSNKPKDWDITTNALPEQIQKLFPDNVYENNFGTIAVKTNSKDPTLKIVEITTFRKESKYSDKRHPDEIKFAKTIKEDLCRRDFTINAIAIKLKDKIKKTTHEIIDPFGGQRDLKNKIIRTVGDPDKRFQEDGLRLMRAIRLTCELNKDWQIEKNTFKAIKENAKLYLLFLKKEFVMNLLK